MPHSARSSYLAARQVVDDMIDGRRPTQMHPDELRRRAIALRSSPEYVWKVRALGGAGDGDGLGFWPLLIVGVGALAAWKGFSWAEEREKRLACEANPDACGVFGEMMPMLVLGVLGLGAYYYVKTGRIPIVDSFIGGGS